MKYEIAEAPTTEELESIVADMIKEGWRPQGGAMSYVVTTHRAFFGNLIYYRFAQAMIKENTK